MPAIPSIRPSSDLRNHYADISRECRETGEPTVLTVNGRGDTVIMSVERYNDLRLEDEMLASVLRAERDVAEGRVGPIAESFSAMHEKIARYAAHDTRPLAEGRVA